MSVSGSVGFEGSTTSKSSLTSVTSKLQAGGHKLGTQLNASDLETTTKTFREFEKNAVKGSRRIIVLTEYTVLSEYNRLLDVWKRNKASQEQLANLMKIRKGHHSFLMKRIEKTLYEATMMSSILYDMIDKTE